MSKKFPKRKIAFFVGFLVIVLVGSGVFALQSPGSSKLRQEKITIESPDGGTHVFNVEMALKPEDQIRGLMWRTYMAEDEGMLFIFDHEAHHQFWMKNTLIPLDMIFIRSNGVIHHIHPNAIPKDETHVSSEGTVSAVLELNGGTTERLDIKEGDVIRHKAFGTD